jgi:hypothetical protein
MDKKLKVCSIEIQGSLETAQNYAVAFLETCSGGGKINPFKKEGVVVGYKAIPKERTFLDGKDIEQIPVYVQNKTK